MSTADLPPEVRQRIDADIEANHTGTVDCPCMLCRLLRAVQREAAARSPWCGTCNPAARTLVTGSDEYRRAFHEHITDPDADSSVRPVPAPLDPTVTS